MMFLLIIFLYGAFACPANFNGSDNDAVNLLFKKYHLNDTISSEGFKEFLHALKSHAEEHIHEHHDADEHTHEAHSDEHTGNEKCDVLSKITKTFNVSAKEQLTPELFVQLCPSILAALADKECPETPNVRGSSSTAWLGAITSMIVIGVISLGCIMIIPIIKNTKYYSGINHFLLALAVGSLSGDALVHLIPHAITMVKGGNEHLMTALIGFVAFIGILMFLVMERLHNLIGHKHSHGHPHSTDVIESDELIKEVGLISSEINQPNYESNGPNASNIMNHENSSPTERKGCFESCPKNLADDDANGNDLIVRSCRPKTPQEPAPESEKLMPDKSDKKSNRPIPPPPLMQMIQTPPKRLVRQDSKNFDMVLQEYHVGHHGHSHHGHSHVTGKKNSLKAMILLGDAMHTVMDGLAIGAAFGTSFTSGVATAIAVLCHELPHKLGDFAILFEMGMTKSKAIKMALFLWFMSIFGSIIGVLVGTVHSVSPWIYAFTAGVFLYLALVDLLSEISISAGELCTAGKQMAVQMAGMVTGSLIMLVIAIYEHDLESVLNQSF